MNEVKPTIDIRSEAVHWLHEELALMNDSGAHWIKQAYMREYSAGAAMCIKGASNVVLVKRLGGVEKMIAAYKALFKYGEDESPAAEAIIAESTAIREVADKAGQSDWVAVQDAVEIALNIAICEKKTEVHVARFFSPDDGESIITHFNDHSGTEWEDVVAIHARAITLIQEGATPLTWKEYGASLVTA